MTTAARDAADWRLRAACRGQDTNLWFIDKGNYGTALEICGGCPVRAECLYEALEIEPAWHRYGMWGGLSGRQRGDLPSLPSAKPDAIALLRELLATTPSPHERTDQPVTTAPAPSPAPPVVDVQLKSTADVRLREPEALPVGKLLKWGDEHPDPDIRDQAARGRAILAGLRARHAADQELTAITTEAEQLEKRLAELRSREAELAPAKPKKKRSGYVRDYDMRTVRAWADANGVDCPRVGQIPKRVLDAWRAAQEPK